MEKSQEKNLPETTKYLLLDMKKRTCPEMGSAPNHSFDSNENDHVHNLVTSPKTGGNHSLAVLRCSSQCAKPALEMVSHPPRDTGRSISTSLPVHRNQQPKLLTSVSLSELILSEIPAAAFMHAHTSLQFL